MPKRSRKVLPLSKKEEVLNFNKERKNHILKSLRFTVRTNCSVTSVKLQKRKKKQQCANFAITPQPAKFTTAVHDVFS